MAYRLSEIMVPQKQLTISNNDFTIKTDTIGIFSGKTGRICPHINAGKRIIFEYKHPVNGICIGFTNNLKTTGVYYQGNISWRFWTNWFVYINTSYYSNNQSYSSILNNTFNFIGGYNTVDYYYHIVLEPSSKRVQIFNPITKVQTHEITMNGMDFSDTYSFFIQPTDFNQTVQGTLNPDVESFKYTPATTYDLDLYQAVLASPQGDIIVPKTKNILSIL